MSTPGPESSHHDWPNFRRTWLIISLVRREIVGRYRGSALGILWSLITPLLMLAVYTFVFGTVFKARWTPPAGTGSAAAGGGTLPPAVEPSVAAFAITLYAGLIVFQLFAEVIGRAPGLVLANPNYVKKIVFPLELLVPTALGSALFHAGVNLAVLLLAQWWIQGAVPLAALMAPLVLLPLCLMILGIGWYLASLGVYFRDINQVIGAFVTALMFLSPVFFPLSALPQWIQPWLALNPVALPIELMRNLLIVGRPPALAPLAAYTAASIVVACLGYLWFDKTRRGFADVL